MNILNKIITLYVNFFIFIVKTLKNKYNSNRIRDFTISFLAGIFSAMAMFILIKAIGLDIDLDYKFEFQIISFFFPMWLTGVGFIFMFGLIKRPDD